MTERRTFISGMKRWPAAFVIVIGLMGCDRLVRWGEDLRLTATGTSLGIGESVRITVKKKVSWFRTAELTDPSKTIYTTTSESALIVEPDGWVTCVGTHGRPRETAWISATNGKSHGHLSFDLRLEGPGPTLDFITAPTGLPPLPDNARSPFVPCCATPLALKEAQQMRFKVQARASGRDLTPSATGTRYTLFFGSGEPNDRRPAIITGGSDAVSARSFLLDEKQGAITAPDSIAHQTFTSTYGDRSLGLKILVRIPAHFSSLQPTPAHSSIGISPVRRGVRREPRGGPARPVDDGPEGAQEFWSSASLPVSPHQAEVMKRRTDLTRAVPTAKLPPPV